MSQKKVQIMEVAEKLFAENGYDGTSVRNIAKVAGINVAMISYYFGSKEKLLEAMLLHRISDYMSELQQTITPAMTPLEKMNCFIKVVISRVHLNRRMHKIVNFEYTKDARSLDFDKYIDQKKENYKIIEDFIKSGQEDGSFRNDIEPVLVVPTVLGTYLHFYYNKRFFQSVLHLPDEKAIDDYVHNTLIPHIQRTIKALLTHEK
ncbi:TetR/AcrR family transcriptional regulator [Flavimarina sp. Hel_I_48]|uniref:TetR/AcrR family transcriptional regulator n=1 Tax=Flavimarina sp. Hel_I_48 TaxID=1392488 RepID=UPI001F13EEE8|nr:TetR family transcriptional regulator [Flavimarina sp. Hel_I_48]